MQRKHENGSSGTARPIRDNTENNVPSYGMKDVAYPGYFVINPAGVVTERFVDSRYDDRRTGNAVVATMFPELIESSGPRIAAPHIEVTVGQTDSLVNLGSHLKLFVDVRLPRGMHVYAPGVRDYRPVELVIDRSEWLKSADASYPRAKVLHLNAIRETVPVYEDRARIVADVVIVNTGALLRALAKAPRAPQPIAITGRLRYQACDERVCYPPNEAPIEWALRVKLPDQQRVSGKE